MNFKVYEKKLVDLAHITERVPVVCVITNIVVAALKIIETYKPFNPEKIFVAYALDRSLISVVFGILGIPLKDSKLGIRETISLAMVHKAKHEQKEFLKLKKRIRFNLMNQHKTEILKDQSLLKSTIIVEPVSALVFAQTQEISKKIAGEIIKINGRILWYLQPSHKRDKEIVLNAIKQAGMAILDGDKRFINDKECVLASIKTFPDVYYELPQNLMADIDVAKALVKYHPDYYTELLESLKDNIRLKNELLKSDPSLIRYMSDADKNNQELGFIAASLDGMTIQYLSQRLRSTYKIIKVAYIQNKDSFQFAPVEFKKLYRTFKEAVVLSNRQDRDALRYAHLTEILQLCMYSYK